MADPVLIPNSDYLGRCYDIVDMDPLNLGATAKSEHVIALDVAEGPTTTTPDGSYTIPAGVHHMAPFSMSWETESSVISSSAEFQEEFKRTVEADAGVDGLFEFSGSASHRELTGLAESRKASFVYSRAYQENHRLTLDLDNAKAPLKVAPEFADAVAELPPQDDPDWFKQYQDLVQRFGTHYTKEIVLGGLAYQWTSGSSQTFLKSSQTEDTFKTHAGVELKTLKGGAGLEEAKSVARKTDSAFQLERGKLEFRGGDGDPSGIDNSWIRSVHDRPAVVKAKLDRISSLLTERFFPEDEYIHDKRILLDMAISAWIAKRGTPGCESAPLRFGEAVVLTLPWPDGKIVQAPVLYNNDLTYPLKDSLPFYGPSESVAVRLESADGRRAGAVILAGDKVRIQHIGRGTYSTLSRGEPQRMSFEGNASQAATCTVLHFADNPGAPSRLGEYVLETDKVLLMTGRPGAPGKVVGVTPSGRFLTVADYDPRYSRMGFSLKRCEPPEPGEGGPPASPVTG